MHCRKKTLKIYVFIYKYLKINKKGGLMTKPQIKFHQAASPEKEIALSPKEMGYPSMHDYQAAALYFGITDGIDPEDLNCFIPGGLDC